MSISTIELKKLPGLRISEIFERLGEPAFRQIEADQLRAALGRVFELKESIVLALGGGTYAQPGAPEFLRAANVPVIWLDSPVEVLLARCMTMTGRPLFRDENSFRALYAQRLPSYQLAEHRVDSSGEPGRVVAEILSRGIMSTGGPKPTWWSKSRNPEIQRLIVGARLRTPPHSLVPFKGRARVLWL